MSANAAYENEIDAMAATLLTKRKVIKGAGTIERDTKGRVNDGAFTASQKREMLNRKCNTSPPMLIRR